MSSILNSFFSKRVVINLPKATERLRHVMNQCESIGLDVEVFHAVDGRANGGVKFKPNKAHQHAWNQGAAGLCYTMINLLRECLSDPNVDSVLILEDDCTFDESFNNVVTMDQLSKIPKHWEMLFFGLWFRRPPIQISDSLVQIPHDGGYSSHCVAIRRSIFELLLSEFLKVREPIDVTYSNRIFCRGHSFAFYPSVAFQKPGYSYILNTRVDYRHLHCFSRSKESNQTTQTNQTNQSNRPKKPKPVLHERRKDKRMLTL